MRLYGGRLLKQNTARQVAASQELHNALVDEVDLINKYCWVYIQGTNTKIKAWFPQGSQETPTYCKPGNSVLITSPGGNGRRIEIAGEGILLPTTILNGPITPTPPTLPDTILTGCTVRPAIPASLFTHIDTGTYRISGVTYTIVPLCMDRTDVEMDRFDITMDELGDTIKHDAASATYYRYDSICVGADGVLQIEKGANFTATGVIPDPPAAPSAHLRLAFVLIPPGLTQITSGEINKLFVAPIATSMSVTVADSELSWAELSTTISIGIKDQYGNWFQNPSGWKLTLAWVRGNGTLSYGSQSTTEVASLVILHTGSGAASVTYTRNHTAGDISPIFTISSDIPSIVAGMARIQLLDSGGLIIP